MKLLLVACVAALVALSLASPAGDAQAVGAAVGEGVAAQSAVIDAKNVQVHSTRSGDTAEASRLLFASAQGYANRGGVLTSAGAGRK